MPSLVPNLVETLIIDGAGHWIQQERPAAVNAALLKFLRAAARA
jgi:pimeloyl-ACP methyl ester carboxylesterase